MPGEWRKIFFEQIGWITKKKEKKYKTVMPIKHKTSSWRAIEKKETEKTKKQGTKKKNKTNVERGKSRKINIWNHSSISACQKNVVKTSHNNLCFITNFAALVVVFVGLNLVRPLNAQTIFRLRLIKLSLLIVLTKASSAETCERRKH